MPSWCAQATIDAMATDSPRPAELHGHLNAKLRNTNHCFDPTMPPSAESIKHHMSAGGSGGSPSIQMHSSTSSAHEHQHRRRSNEVQANAMQTAGLGCTLAEMHVQSEHEEANSTPQLKRAHSMTVDDCESVRRRKLEHMDEDHDGATSAEVWMRLKTSGQS